MRIFLKKSEINYHLVEKKNISTIPQDFGTYCIGKLWWLRGAQAVLPEPSRDLFVILGRGPRAFQIGKISAVNP